MSSPIRVTLFSLLGACAIHVAFVACSSTSKVTSSGAPGEGTAHAEPTSPAAAPCARWQVKAFMPTGFSFKSVPITESDGSRSTISLPSATPLDLPEGWEPFAAEGYGAVIARHCAE